MTHAEKAIRNKEMKAYKAEGHTLKEVAQQFNVSEGTAQNVCKGIARQRPIYKYIEPPNKGIIKSDEQVAFFIAERCKGFEYAGNYTGADGRADIKCKKCGNVFNRSMISIRHNDFKCRECERIEKEKQEANKELHKWFNSLVADIRREEKEISKQEKREQKKHPCPVCGRLTTRRKFCSNECYRKTTNYLRGSRDRLNKANIIDRDITLERLYKKEWGVCYLCGDSCDWEDITINRRGVYIAGDLYPSIDHVIPLAKGGLHSWDNVRLAHRRCNWEKSAKLGIV